MNAINMYLVISDCTDPDVIVYRMRVESGNVVYGFDLLENSNVFKRQLKEFQRELRRAGCSKNEIVEIMGAVGNTLTFFRKNRVFVRTCRNNHAFETRIKPPYKLILAKLRYLQFLNNLDCNTCEAHCQASTRYYECLEECCRFCRN